MMETKLVDSIRSQVAKIRFGNLIKRARNSMNPDCEKDAFSKATETLISLSHKSNNFLDLVLLIIDMLPLSDPLSPAFICHFLEVTAIPKPETLQILSQKLIGKYNNLNDKNLHQTQVNCAIVWGILAEKLAGKGSEKLFTEDLKTLLIENLKSNNKQVALFSLIALDKFSITKENKKLILCGNITKELDQLLKINTLHSTFSYCLKQSIKNFSDHVEDLNYEELFKNVRCTLNWTNAPSTWKVSDDFLEIRNDRIEFLSIKGTTTITDGCWYYEVELLSSGIMQIGWATQSCIFKADDGMGVGDDTNSFGYDGCRKLVWTGGEPSPYGSGNWKEGDFVGVLFNIDSGELKYYLNGIDLGLAIFLEQGDLLRLIDKEGGFQPAFSFTAFQQARVNFGATKFRFEPDFNEYKLLNDFGQLSKQLKMGPYYFYKNLDYNSKPGEKDCEICFSSPSSIRILPCLHEGVCYDCVLKMTQCPFCRLDIKSWEKFN